MCTRISSSRRGVSGPRPLAFLLRSAGLVACLGLSISCSAAPDEGAAEDEVTDADSEGKWKPGKSGEASKGSSFVWIEAGDFQMGSSASERSALTVAGSGVKPEWLHHETMHTVTLTEGYWMAETEVTIAHYLRFLNTTRHWDEEWLNTDGRMDCPLVRNEDGSFVMREGKGPAWGDETLPMVLVSWAGAIAYCDWLQTTEGNQLPKGYRFQLPTEAQWEYACRAGTSTMTPVGDFVLKGKNNAPELGPIAWYGGNCGVGAGAGWDSSGWEEMQEPHQRAGLHPVKQKEANEWGLYDMIGNAREWCADWFDEHGELTGATDPSGPEEGTFRVTRGGSWYDFAYMCRSAARDAEIPEVRTFFQGFRVAASPERSPVKNAKSP